LTHFYGNFSRFFVTHKTPRYAACSGLFAAGPRLRTSDHIPVKSGEALAILGPRINDSSRDERAP
jgi:hypothetical protein